MKPTAVVIGGGIAGLGTALLLARSGWTVDVVERDPMPDIADGDDAFAHWERRSVPQWRFAHVFASRSRSLLLERAPDVLERLRRDGVTEINYIEKLVAREQWRADDAHFTMVQARRPAFELALRRAAEEQPGVRMMASAVVAGLVVQPGSVPRVLGVQIENAAALHADLVVDCGGRRSPVPSWLATLGIEAPTLVEDCQLTYYTRYFRLRDRADLDKALVSGDLGYLLYAVLGGDHGTYALTLAAPPWDSNLKGLRHDVGWEAMASSIPDVAPWVEPSRGQPLTPVQVMAGHRSIRRHYLVDDALLAHGIVSVGDALCTSNPFFAWGASMALTHAVALVDALTGQPGDVAAAAVSYYRAIGPETDAVYRSSSASDRIRSYRWRNEQIPAHDVAAAEHEDLIRRGLLPGIRQDPELLRATLRRAGLIEHPDAIFDDPDVLARAAAVRDSTAASELKGPQHAAAAALIADALVRN